MTINCPKCGERMFEIMNDFEITLPGFHGHIYTNANECCECGETKFTREQKDLFFRTLQNKLNREYYDETND